MIELVIGLGIFALLGYGIIWLCGRIDAEDWE